MLKYFFSIFLLLIFLNEAQSQPQSQISICQVNGTEEQDCLNIISTAVPLLNANVDAASGAMGETGIALSSKTNAIFYNSAKIIFNEDKAGVSLNYAPWLRSLGITDIYLTNFAGFYKIDEFQAIGASVRYFSFGEFTFTDLTGFQLFKYQPKEYYVDLAYAAKLSNQLSVGVDIKYIHSDLAKGANTLNSIGMLDTVVIGNAVALDLSAFYTQELSLSGMDGNFNAGLSFSNIGNKISYLKSDTRKHFLPTNLGIGVAYDLNFDNGSKITLAYDANKLMVPTPKSDGSDLDKSAIGGMFSSFADASFKEELAEITHALGAESYIRLFEDGFGIARAGLFREHQTKGNRKYFTFGLGFKYRTFEIAFSRILDDLTALKNTYKLTLQYHL